MYQKPPEPAGGPLKKGARKSLHKEGASPKKERFERHANRLKKREKKRYKLDEYEMSTFKVQKFGKGSG